MPTKADLIQSLTADQIKAAILMHQRDLKYDDIKHMSKAGLAKIAKHTTLAKAGPKKLSCSDYSSKSLCQMEGCVWPMGGPCLTQTDAKRSAVKLGVRARKPLTEKQVKTLAAGRAKAKSSNAMSKEDLAKHFNDEELKAAIMLHQKQDAHLIGRKGRAGLVRLAKKKTLQQAYADRKEMGGSGYGYPAYNMYYNYMYGGSCGGDHDDDYLYY